MQAEKSEFVKEPGHRPNSAQSRYFLMTIRQVLPLFPILLSILIPIGSYLAAALIAYTYWHYLHFQLIQPRRTTVNCLIQHSHRL